MLERLRTDPFAQAAVAYLTYGLVYLGGAVAELSPERRAEASGAAPWWVYYVAGAALVVVLPTLLWRFRWRWLAGGLAVLVAGKGLYLAWQQGRHAAVGEPSSAFRWVFAAVALATAALLVRAAWTRTRRVEEAVP